MMIYKHNKLPIGFTIAVLKWDAFVSPDEPSFIKYDKKYAGKQLTQ